MTYDPNRTHDYPDRVVGYGADDHSSGYYAMLFAGVLVAMAAIFYVISYVGGSRTMHANNPLDTKATTGQAVSEPTVTPGLLPTAPRQ